MDKCAKKMPITSCMRFLVNRGLQVPMCFLIFLTTIGPTAGATEVIADSIKNLMNVGRGASQFSSTYVVFDKSGQTRVPVYVHIETATKNERKKSVSKELSETESRLPAEFRKAITYRFNQSRRFSMVLSLDQIERLSEYAFVKRINPRPKFKIHSSESHPLTNVTGVHNQGLFGNGATIAIVDDGIDSDHAAFGGHAGFPTPKIIAGASFGVEGAGLVNNDPRIECAAQSHGTAVAGVAAGNGGGVVGVAPEASIVFAKIQLSEDCGSFFLNGDVSAAIDWIVANQATHGTDIISMSFGGVDPSHQYGSDAACRAAPEFADLTMSLDNASASGLVLVASAGNLHQTEALSHPACLGSVISVGATFDSNLDPHPLGQCIGEPSGVDAIACYSNASRDLDVWAPADCATTAAASLTSTTAINQCFNGTSSSAPFVAGSLALVVEASGQNWNSNIDMIRNLLNRGPKKIRDTRNFDPEFDSLEDRANAARIDVLSMIPEGSGQICGDGVVQGTEECDGTDLGAGMCSIAGCSSGELACSSNCTLDYSGCSDCCNNNGSCETNETIGSCPMDCSGNLDWLPPVLHLLMKSSDDQPPPEEP